MKKLNKLFALCVLILLTNVATYAQEALKYRRSSLHTVLVETGSFPNKNAVVNAYNKYPFPDKYNKHTVGAELLPKKNLSVNDFKKLGFVYDTLTNPLKISKALVSQKNLTYLNQEKSKAVVQPAESDSVLFSINKFIEDNKIASNIVQKWYNVDKNMNYNFDLVMERGQYSASAEDKDIAGKMATGKDYFYDEELIGNTFVIFTKLKFYPNEPVARAIQAYALLQAQEIKVAMVQKKAVEKANDLYETTKEGYTVVTTSYLYQLDWNKETVQAMKDKVFNETDLTKRKNFFETSDILKLKFIGEQTARTLVTFKLGEKRTEEQVIDLSVKRNIDKVYTMLQKEYEVFRPVTPVSTSDPITARIGLKEGVEAGQKFEVLESSIDKKTGLQSWKSIGSVKVDDKLPIWDNTFGAEPVQGSTTPLTEFTTFKGGTKCIPGMHFLRLKK